jgi:hypothetical protein
MTRNSNGFMRENVASIAATIASAVIGLGLFLFASVDILILYAVVLLSICLGFLVYLLAGHFRRTGFSDHPLELPFAIAHDEEIYEHYLSFSRSIKRISQIPDPVYREAAIEKIKEIEGALQSVALGTLTFESTESWRLVYESLLRSPSVYLYRSVSWARNASYWQDEPGRKSTLLNFELVNEQRVNIERIVIIADSLWRKGERLPSSPLLEWIDEHRKNAIWIKLVRESALESEPDLLVDMGIYGSHAVGQQILDPDGKTTRYVVRFDFSAVEAAEQRWKRLSLYATSYRDLLDNSR